MLVIGHRGAAGLARENTIEALRLGAEAGADILEFDVRLTKDGVPILAHDPMLKCPDGRSVVISRHTWAQLQEYFANQRLTTLKEVLDEFFGIVLLNLEIKGRGNGSPVARFVKDGYIKSAKDWDNILFSSFHATELIAVRRVSKHASLALLHSSNPYIFIAYHRLLRLSAVGFHRLYVSEFALEIARRAGLFTYVYTVDRPHAALLFSQQNIDGIVTNRPDLVLREINKQKA